MIFFGNTIQTLNKTVQWPPIVLGMFSEFRPLLLNNAIVKTIMRLPPKKDTCYTSEKAGYKIAWSYMPRLHMHVDKG